MSMEIVAVMGKSGAGKHRFVEAVRALRGLEKVATGDHFRSASASVAARRAAAAGVWAADAAADAFVAGALARCAAAHTARGCVLDGYPRTVPQAETLLALAATHGAQPPRGRLDVVLVDAPDAVLAERMRTRRVCTNSACAAVYNTVVRPPTPDGRCWRCGARVAQRRDDGDAQRIAARLRQFAERTLPAIELLRARGVPVHTLPGDIPVDDDARLRDMLIKHLGWDKQK